MEYIDVSSNNGPLTTQMMAGCDGVFVKATQGTRYVNPLKQQQANAANLANKIIGNYHWAEPFANTPEAEATWFRNHLEGNPTILAVDVEDTQIQGDISSWTMAFCNIVEQATGIPVMIYSFAPFIRQHLQNRALINYSLWLAAYQSKQPTPPLPWLQMNLWQYQGSPLDRSKVILPLPIAGSNQPNVIIPPIVIYPAGKVVPMILYQTPGQPAVWLTNGQTKQWLETQAEVDTWVLNIAALGLPTNIGTMTAAVSDAIPLVGKQPPGYTGQFVNVH